jgi:hypothetical protein
MRVDVPHACGINVTEMMYLEGLCRLLDTVLSNCTASPKIPSDAVNAVYVRIFISYFQTYSKSELLLYQRNEMATLQPSQMCRFFPSKYSSL